MTQARLGFGGTFKVGNGASPEVFTAVAEVIDVPPIGESAALVDASNLDSANQTLEYIAGAKDGIEFTVEMNLLPANLSTIVTNFQAQTTKNYQITIPTSPVKTFAFAAVPLGWTVTGPHADKMTLSANFKVTGAVTVT